MGEAEQSGRCTEDLRKKRCIKCCTYISVILLIETVVAIILAFTIFKVRDPVIHTNKVTFDQLGLFSGANTSLTADVSVKNLNYATFMYPNATITTLSYHGTVIGEAYVPPGTALARHSMRMNVTVQIITDRILAKPSLSADMRSGLMTMNTYSIVPGRVNLIGFIKMHVIVKMNCSMIVNVTSQDILEQKCKRKYKF